MLQPILHHLATKRIILASGSPRRQELIKNIVSKMEEIITIFLFHNFTQGLNADLVPSLFEENLNVKDFANFAGFVEETALQKVLEVDGRLAGRGEAHDIIIGADTIVTLDGQMFGKPKTPEIAFETLNK